MINTEGVYAKTHRRLALIMKTLIDKPCSFREVMLWEIHMKGILEMLERLLKLAGLTITTINTVVKILDLAQQWKDKKASKKQPPEPR